MNTAVSDKQAWGALPLAVVGVLSAASVGFMVSDYATVHHFDVVLPAGLTVAFFVASPLIAGVLSAAWAFRVFRWRRGERAPHKPGVRFIFGILMICALTLVASTRALDSATARVKVTAPQETLHQAIGDAELNAHPGYYIDTRDDGSAELIVYKPQRDAVLRQLGNMGIDIVEEP